MTQNDERDERNYPDFVEGMWGENHIEVMTASSPERDKVFDRLTELAKQREPSTLTLRSERP